MLRTIFVATLLFAASACASTRSSAVVRAQDSAGDVPSLPPIEAKNGDDAAESDNKEDADAKKVKCPRPPKTLFEWAIGHDCQCSEDDEDDDEEEEEEPPLIGDRPDFTESSTNVGVGRVQLEMGYTYFHDREGTSRFRGHSYPEMLVRIGMFADWFELRLGQNLGDELTIDDAEFDNANGAEDLYLGVGLALTEQKGCLPESRLILQARIPTGSDDLSADEVLPGFNLLYGWDVIPDCLTCAGSTQVNRSIDDDDSYYVEVAQSFTVGYSITDRLGAYTEYFGLFPAGARLALPEHYFNGGLMYLVHENLQFDIRAGMGLNRHADDFFTGAGFVRRF